MKTTKQTDASNSRAQEPDARTRILDAACELLCEGTEEVTLREVANRAGVGLGLINYHFGTRDALIREAIRRYVNTAIIRPYRTGPNEQSTRIPKTKERRRELFAGMLRGPVDFLADHPNIARISIQFDLHLPAKGDNSEETIHRLIAGVEPWIAEEDNAARMSYRLRIFATVAAIHEAFLRPEAFTAQTGLDYSRKSDRDSFRMLLAHMVFP